MPLDAKIVGVSDHPSFGRGLYTFKVWSSEFCSIPNGTAIPDLTVEIKQIEDNKRGREFI